MSIASSSVPLWKRVKYLVSIAVAGKDLAGKYNAIGHIIMSVQATFRLYKRGFEDDGAAVAELLVGERQLQVVLPADISEIAASKSIPWHQRHTLFAFTIFITSSIH